MPGKSRKSAKLFTVRLTRDEIDGLLGYVSVADTDALTETMTEEEREDDTESLRLSDGVHFAIMKLEKAICP